MRSRSEGACSGACALSSSASLVLLLSFLGLRWLLSCWGSGLWGWLAGGVPTHRSLLRP